MAEFNFNFNDMPLIAWILIIVFGLALVTLLLGYKEISDFAFFLGFAVSLIPVIVLLARRR